MPGQLGARLWAAALGQGLFQLALVALALAWLLTKTSTSLAANVPLALLCVATVRWGARKLERQQRARLMAARQEARTWLQERQDLPPPATPAPQFGVAPGAAKPESWRKFVRAPVVEEAWARFCGSIVQEFIYDTWYATLSPDREFPAEVRRLLNTAFGQLAMRARRLDLRAVMNDLCELCMEQLELYRDTRESILLATQQPHCLRDMAPPARDRAFRREMAAEKNLHPALQTPEGHYKFLRAVSEGVVAYLMDVEDLKRPAARVVCREMLAAAVLRPLLMWATPYYANKALFSVLKEQQAPQKAGPRAKEAEEVSAELAAARSEAMRGHWEFEQRLLSSAEGEAAALAAARQLRHQLRSKLSQHGRSRSADLLPPVHGAEAAHEPQRPAAAAAAVPAAAGQRLQPHQQAHLHARARSVSPAEMAGLREQQVLTSSGSSGHHGRLSQLRPPRPPALQSDASGPAALADAAQQQQQQTQPPPSRQQAISEELGLLAEGWEAVDSVEASEASLSLAAARREFSAAHLLAPQVDRAAVAGVTPRATSSSSCGAEAQQGFSGAARAKVVAADLNTSSSKDYVEFKIRVADDAAEWTVSRRYRNFESLHRQLRGSPAYRLKLPPKRIFIHSHHVEFVEERREALDKYLQALLAHETLRHSPDLFEFLRAGSQLYELASPPPMLSFRQAPSAPDQQQQQRKMLGGLSRAVLESTQSMGRGLSSAGDAVAGLGKQSVQGMSDLAAAASGGVAKAASGVMGAAGAVVGALALSGGEADPHAGLTRRAQSVPSALKDLGDAQQPTPRGNSGSALPRGKSSGGLLAKASQRLRGNLGREGSSPQLLEPSGHSGSSSAGSEQSSVQQDREQLPPGAPAGGNGSFSASPSKKASKLFSSLRRKSRSISPQKQPRERSPSRRPRRGTESASSSVAASRRNSGELPKGGGPSPGVPPHLVSSLGPPSPFGPPSPLASFPIEPSLDPDDCAGISAPLYEMVDCLFQLQTRGFFRRQVYAVARQALSLVAGEAIDAFLLSQLSRLREQHTIGRIMQQVQASLWPGGVWFQYTPAGQAQRAAAAAYQAQQAAQQAAQQRRGGTPASAAPPASSGGYVRPEGMQADKFLEPGGPPPLDADEIREAVEQLLVRRAPATVLRLIGKTAYASGVRDLYDMLQSPTFCHQLGYGVLEVCIVHLVPELKALFRTLQHGGLG